MSKYSESELLIPSIIALGNNGGSLPTTDLIIALQAMLAPSGEDLDILNDRNDTKFSQKVRNIIAHKSYSGWAVKTGDGLALNADGLRFYSRFHIQNALPTVSSATHSDRDISLDQIIYYGVPGCGKSHKIAKMLEDEKISNPTFSEENQVVRTTFHPEYTNADFIGQVMPEVINGDVKYKFKSGPFSVILKKALLNPSKKHYLVIEEINRGNAAAIFGDVFQLLDRLKEGGTSKTQVGSDGFNNHYGKGWSEYFVMNSDVNAFIRGVDESQELDTKAIDVSGVHFSSNTGLRLPPNLSIYATLNTSDQNVFTLDNAFQRRWDMKLIDNSCKWDDNDHKNQALVEIRETGICWEAFRDTINKKIAEAKVFNADDKQLGLFFMEAEGDGANKKIDQAKFANKVLKYLWTDVFKRDRDGDGIFLAKNMSDLVNNFNESNAFEKTFKKEFVDELKKWTAPFQTPVETPIVNDKSQSA